MKTIDLGKGLSNRTRVNLLKILSRESCSAVDAYRKYVKLYDDKHRETIYRELEKLVDLKIIEKTYDEKEKQLLYSLPYEKICITIGKDEIIIKKE